MSNMSHIFESLGRRMRENPGTGNASKGLGFEHSAFDVSMSSFY
jgi:hypothetical protein